MNRNWTRLAGAGVGLVFGTAGIALARWKRKRLAELAAGSTLLTTDRGVVEVARRGSGYPILLLHGGPGGYDQGLFVGETLFGDDVELIAPSRAGYLRTPLDGDGSFEEQAALFVALLDELDVSRALVVGFSAGGPIALQLATDYPDRVTGLVLVSAVTKEMDDRWFEIGNPFVDPILTATPVLDVRSGLLAALQRFDTDTFIERAHASISTLEGEELAAYAKSIRANPQYREQLLAFLRTLFPESARVEGDLSDERWFREYPSVAYETIECPVLVVHGTFDGAVPLDHAESVVDAVSNVELVTLAADHLVLVGPAADRAREAVQAFTDSVTASGEPTTL